MELRRELMPPVLDEDLVARLAGLADRLDGAPAGVCEEDLANFNRLAGTNLEREAFQGIYKVQDADNWVRWILYEKAINPVPEVSRAEMVEIVSRVLAHGDEHDFYLALFLACCKHPAESDLIFWPNHVAELPQDREPSAEEIADCALGWEPRIVAMQITQRSGGESVGCYLYRLEAPGTPSTQVVTPLDIVYEPGAVVAVALKGVVLEDGSVVDTTYDLGAMSCGTILGVTDRPAGARITSG